MINSRSAHRNTKFLDALLVRTFNLTNHLLAILFSLQTHMWIFQTCFSKSIMIFWICGSFSCLFIVPIAYRNNWHLVVAQAVGMFHSLLEKSKPNWSMQVCCHSWSLLCFKGSSLSNPVFGKPTPRCFRLPSLKLTHLSNICKHM